MTPTLPPLPPACFATTFQFVAPAGVTGDASYLIHVGNRTLLRGTLRLDGPTSRTFTVCFKPSAYKRVVQARAQAQWDDECASCDAAVTIRRVRR
jgi:hypothetical protein